MPRPPRGLKSQEELAREWMLGIERANRLGKNIWLSVLGWVGGNFLFLLLFHGWLADNFPWFATNIDWLFHHPWSTT